jgi:hypothetical protein
MEMVPEPKNGGYGYQGYEVLRMFPDRESALRVYGAVGVWVLNRPEGYYESMGKPLAKSKFAQLAQRLPDAAQSDEWAAAVLGDAMEYVRDATRLPDVNAQRELIASVLEPTVSN